MSRIDLEPATCSDPQCDADHGYTGVFASDDFSLRVSAAADGSDAVAGLLVVRRVPVRPDPRGVSTDHHFVEPAYGARSLGDVLPAVASALGSPIGDPPTRLALPGRGVVRRVPGRRSRGRAAAPARARGAVPLLTAGRPGRGDRRRAVDHRDQPDLARHRAHTRDARPGRVHLPDPGHRQAAERPVLGQVRRSRSSGSRTPPRSPGWPRRASPSPASTSGSSGRAG